MFVARVKVVIGIMCQIKGAGLQKIHGLNYAIHMFDNNWLCSTLPKYLLAWILAELTDRKQVT
jgi:hypothetical protein